LSNERITAIFPCLVYSALIEGQKHLDNRGFGLRLASGESRAEGGEERLANDIRAYDPCLSCSTHAVGQMPLLLELISPDGSMLKRIARS